MKARTIVEKVARKALEANDHMVALHAAELLHRLENVGEVDLGSDDDIADLRGQVQELDDRVSELATALVPQLKENAGE